MTGIADVLRFTKGRASEAVVALSQNRNHGCAELKPCGAMFVEMARKILKSRMAAAATLAFAGAQPAIAAETAQFLKAPVEMAAPPARLAVQYELQLNLPEGRGLARLLIEAGVSQDDAAAAARLASGHLGEEIGGCQAKVSVSRGSDGRGFALERVTLFTNADQTVIERRRGELAVASSTANRRYPRLV